MNKHDKRVRELIEENKKIGYTGVYNKGAPDILFIKLKDKSKPITKDNLLDYYFEEVKVGKDGLSYEQRIWRDLLLAAGIKYKLNYVPSNASPIQPSSSPTRPH